MKKKYKGIDLFCGIGGFRLAMNSNQVECVFSSDNDKFAQQTYEANFHEVPTGDIKAVDEKDIPQFDILTAGFPCQPFSYAGEKQGFNDEVRGTLFFDICRILEYHKPPMVFLENVKGLKSHNKGKTLRTILDTLKELGYYPHWTILSSLDYGLPQKRERWYCVAFRTDVNFEWPKPIKGHPVLRDIIDMDDKNPSLAIPKFELDRIDYHFANAKPGDRIQHDGRFNCEMQFLFQCSGETPFRVVESDFFPGPFVYFVLYLFDLLCVKVAEVRVFWYVLPDEPVGVLAQPPFP